MDDLRGKVSDSILALMPVYYRHILKIGAGISGIRIAQYRVLGLLMKSGALSMSEIGRHLYISKSYMIVLVDTLIENRWVEHWNDPDGRRAIKITITAQGKKHIQQAFEIYHVDVKNLISGLGTEDLERLAASLEELQMIFAKLG
jgi:DNA-binding MarR family transcriptional regulator